MTESTVLPTYLEVEGDWKEMGSAHGEHCGEAIHELAAIRIDYLARKYGRGKLEVIKTIAHDLADQIEHDAPTVYAETLATSRAAGLAYWMLLVAGAFSDIDDLVSRTTGTQNAPHQECTLIPIRLASGDVVISGTWDTHGDAARYHFVLRRNPRGQPATLALTTFGWPMQQGLTSMGLAFAVANLVAQTTRRGMPYISVLPLIAACETLDSALATVTQASHCSGRFYCLANKSEYRGVEVVPGIGTFVSSSQLMPHTNHYIFDSARVWEGRSAQTIGSKNRLQAASTKAKEAAKADSWSDVFQLFTDGLLTQHGHGDDDRTGATFVVWPGERTLYFVSGSPRASDIPQHVRQHTI